MEIQRNVGQAPQTTMIAKDVSAMHAPCVGCKDCKGLCTALIELMYFPDLILRPKYAE